MLEGDYGFSDRLLHRLSLGVSFIRKVSFDMDSFFYNTKQEEPEGKHVFVSGLARSGTTILMRTLYDTGCFRSLTYRDMPFVLMPNLWKMISGSFYKHEIMKERAHGDGIKVNFDSPEAFEEVFWKTFSDEYIFDSYLRPYDVDSDLIAMFRQYVKAIIASSVSSEQKKYLSKNNNNILRLAAIREAFPDALIVIPFRDPVQQAISLLNQHLKFCDRHSKDKFSSDYMFWLGHHEFGLTHRRFAFKDETSSYFNEYDTNNINYWLGIWISVNSYLLENAPSESIYICFEELCKLPLETLKRLFEAADLIPDREKLTKSFNMPSIRNTSNINENMKKSAYEIYEGLRSKSLS